MRPKLYEDHNQRNMPDLYSDLPRSRSAQPLMRSHQPLRPGARRLHGAPAAGRPLSIPAPCHRTPQHQFPAAQHPVLLASSLSLPAGGGGDVQTLRPPSRGDDCASSQNQSESECFIAQIIIGLSTIFHSSAELGAFRTNYGFFKFGNVGLVFLN